MEYGIKHKRKIRETEKKRAMQLYGKSPCSISLSFFKFFLKLNIVTQEAASLAWNSFKNRYGLHE